MVSIKINDFEASESGTVRAILALSAMLVASYSLIQGLAPAEWLVGLMGLVGYYYFEHKKSTSTNEPSVDGNISVQFKK